MSVFEPHTEPAANGASQLPALDVVLRGRKGQQVSAYIQELVARLDQQSARAEQSERAAARLRREVDVLRNQPPPSFEHLGAEAAKVLEDAGHSAKALLEQARGQGRVIVEQAKARAAELVEAAERDAHARQTAARQAAEQILAKANGERSVLDAETRRLGEYRDRLLGHLDRVQADLARFLAEASEAPPVPAPAADAENGARADARARADAEEGARVDAGAGADAEDGAETGPGAEPTRDAASAQPEPAQDDSGAEPEPEPGGARAVVTAQPVQSAIATIRAPR